MPLVPNRFLVRILHSCPYVKDMPLEEDVDRAVLVRLTPGFSGADIWRLVNEAALLAAKREKQRIAMAEFESVLAQFRPPKT